MDFTEQRENLVTKLNEKGYIENQKVIRAMKKVPRHKFLPKKQRKNSYLDQPLPIGEDQTISAPHMVGILVEEMKLKGNEKVLEIGTGSGYNAAVIAEILSNGKVISIEKISSIAEKARKNLEKTGYDKKVSLKIGDGSKGYKKESPYDRILLTAGAPSVPKPLEEQLKDGGKIVGPVGGERSQELIVVTKKDKEMKYEKKGRCAFVPLKGDFGY